MMYFMQAGGIAMWFILLFGLCALVASGLYAWKPSEKSYGFMRAMASATLFTSLGGMCAGFASTLYAVANNPKWAESPDIHLIVMQGLGESLSSPILGFCLLAISWVVIAVGIRRKQSD